MNSTNILWIDRWTKQIGLAYTKQWIVLPWGVLPNDGELYFALAGVVAQYHISQIVIWYPKWNKWAAVVDRMVRSLWAIIPDCVISTIDEHYTTIMAQEILWDYDKRKWFDDCVAAMEIVRRWMLQHSETQIMS